MEKDTLFQDPKFRRIIVWSTGLALALGMASLAALRVSNGVGFDFAWHWSLPVLVFIAVLWNSRFWKVVWEMEDRPHVNSRRKLVFYLAGFSAMGVGSFLYPVRFIEQAHRSGVLEGL